MEPYHLRRQDKALTDQEELVHVLESAEFVTLAMCNGDEPYAVVLNHGYDEKASSLYFHCAPEGKKVEFLNNNPRVWGIAFVDHGYMEGKCDHAYTSVMFGGTVEWVEGSEAKRRALEVMIHQLEPDPRTVMAEQMTDKRIEGVTIGRVRITEMTGKRALP